MISMSQQLSVLFRNLVNTRCKQSQLNLVRLELFTLISATVNAAFELMPSLLLTLPIRNIAILGAGGGPLVTKTMDALARLERSACVWAVEKNPSAFQYLQHKNQSEWNSKVKLAECDMREWMPPSKMDIVISELLGSFGDNELSPECLEKVPKILSRTYRSAYLCCRHRSTIVSKNCYSKEYI